RGPIGWNPSPGRSTWPRSTSCRHPGPGRVERGAPPRGSGEGVQQLKRESGKGLFVGGVKLPLALAELGLIDEYKFVVHPRLDGALLRPAGPRPDPLNL